MSGIGKKKPKSVTKAEALAVLAAIDGLTGDDFCVWLSTRDAHRKLRGDLAKAFEKLLAVYRLAHGWNPANDCFDVHEGWRAEAKP